MESFLTSCQDLLKGNGDDSQGFHVVLGNEACDLDSMVSALAYAYFLFKTQPGDKRPFFPLPMLNLAQSALVLRSDSVFLLRQCGLEPDLLPFREQLDLRRLHRLGLLRLTLVDHNVLPSSDSDLEGAVVEVIDHHHLERDPSPSCPVTVETVGSCATLVTERIVQKTADILDQQLALLLYGTIVLDCVNMAPEAGKVTPKDSQIAALLEARFPSLPPRGALFQSLQNAKFDVSGLSTQQMLLKDMKAVAEGDLNLAVSVIYMTLEEFLQRADLDQDLSSFCQKHGYDVLIAMTIAFNNKQQPFRQLAVYSHSTLYREEVSQALEDGRPSLSLRPMSCPYPHVKAYHQGNALASRKKLLPIVKDFLRGREMGGACLQGDQEEEDTQFPPTPMNSLVEGCPLDGGLPLAMNALQEKFSKMADSC